MHHFVAILLITLSCTVAEAKGLRVGDKAPQIKVNDIKGKLFDLQQQVKKGPVTIVFYRGGWCPYCNLQLRKIQKTILPVSKSYKGEIVAISVDQLKKGLETQKKNTLGFVIITDPDARLVKAYGLSYTLPATLVKKYKESYKIDVEGASGRKHHILPVPAVYVVNNQGKVVFAYANEDYKVRAAEKDIIEAIKKVGLTQ